MRTVVKGIDTDLDTAGRGLLLIVDDHADTLQRLSEIVSGTLPTWQVLTAVSGEQALQLAAERAPDAALVDITLGGINGFTTTRGLLALQPSTVVIVMSLQCTSPYRDEALAAGAVGFLDKREAASQLGPLLHKMLALLR